jgi:hypothetical protein
MTSPIGIIRRALTSLAILIMFSVLLYTCSPSTRITGSWVDPSAKGQPVQGKRVFIASLTRNMEVRTKVENALAEQAAQRNILVIKSTEYFSPDFYQKLPEEKALLQQIRNSGGKCDFDSISDQ